MKPYFPSTRVGELTSFTVASRIRQMIRAKKGRKRMQQLSVVAKKNVLKAAV